MKEYSDEHMLLTIFDGLNAPKVVNLDDLAKNNLTIGRSPDNDIILTSTIVSKYHAQLQHEGDDWYLIDWDSANGIRVEEVPVQRVRLQIGNRITIMVDDAKEHSVVMLFGLEGKSSAWQGVNIQGKKEITIGRDNNCDIVLKNSTVSKVQARITCTDNNYILYENKYSNGVLVNGEKVDKCVHLSEKDIILIANAKIIFSEHYISYVIYDDGVQLEARDVIKTVRTSKGKLNIVNHMDLNIEAGEFVAIIGGSGAGKSSLLNCISGYSKPTSGQVLVNGDDLYENYEMLKQMIGYVPQVDIVYDNLTVQSMLEYAAMLRMPKDTSSKERKEKVAEVISMVELNGREKFMIKNLSGGQKKRVSIAVELLSDPQLFFLDEPSSGLDPGTEEKLMETLYKMSRMGKTIILITHNTMNIHLCDKIVFLGKGGMRCYCGTPEAAYDFFGVNNLVKVYNMVTDDPEKWQKHYEELLTGHVDEPRIKRVNTARRVSRKGVIRKQTGILARRYTNLILHDVKRLLLLILQAPLLGYLIHLVADSEVFEIYESTKAILFAVSCCAFWVGILNSIQEVCKERHILKRERLSGLSNSAYVFSKFIVLGVICMIQAILLIETIDAFIGLPKEGILFSVKVEFLITTFLTAFSATAMGLLVSAMFNNADRAMTVAPILLMPQILFSGLAFSLTDAVEKISYIVTCRWAMEAYGSTANLNELMLRIQKTIPEMEHEVENLYVNSVWHLMFSWEILIGFTIIFGALSYIALANIEKS